MSEILENLPLQESEISQELEIKAGVKCGATPSDPAPPSNSGDNTTIGLAVGLTLGS